MASQEEKLRETLLYVLWIHPTPPRRDDDTLTRILYHADRIAAWELGGSITGVEYVRASAGVEPAGFEDLVREMGTLATSGCGPGTCSSSRQATWCSFRSVPWTSAFSHRPRSPSSTLWRTQCETGRVTCSLPRGRCGRAFRPAPACPSCRRLTMRPHDPAPPAG